MTPSPDARFQAAIADRYVIDRVVGRGGMGTVYLARDVKHGRQVAIKVLSPETVSRLGPKRFLREIRLTARLQHPHILPLLDSGEAGGSPYYVMPYVKGGSLRELLTQKIQLPVDEALELAREVGGALRYAHENFVLHCDLKPENILLSAGHAVLADFGVARGIHAGRDPWQHARPEILGGTAQYASTEQATGERQLDARSDVYSLGCVLYEVLAGEPPFSGATDREAIASRFTRPVPDIRTIAPHVPVAVARVIKRALAVDPGHRFKSVAKFCRALENAAGVTAVSISGARRSPFAVLSNWRFAYRRLAARSRRTLEAARAGAQNTTGVGLSRNSIAG